MLDAEAADREVPGSRPKVPSDLLREVGEFLASLRRELPDLFVAPAVSSSQVRRIPYRGQELALRVVADPLSARSRIEEAEGELVLRRCPDDPRYPRELLNDWYRQKAAQAFSERAEHWSRAMGLSFNRIAIKDQRSLWGSCSAQGNLNFNWRVVMAPPEVLDYLVIHELAHLREMNHSRSFWREVASYCPDFRERRRWLKEHSGRLKGR